MEGHEVAKKYPRTPHLPFSPGVQSDDVVIGEAELGSLPLLSEETVLTEKLDGANCSIYRGTPYMRPFKKVDGLVTHFKVYSRTVNTAATHPSFGPVKELACQLNYCMPDNIQLFGENMFGVHSIEYDGLTSFFYVFAGLRDGEQWLGWDELCGLARDLDVPTVPLLNRQTFSSFGQLQQTIQLDKSQCGSCPAEGVVLRTVRGFSFHQFDRHTAKYVRENHIQTDATWRRTWKQATLVK